MSLRTNIKQVLKLLNKAISQTPLDKQPILQNKVAKIIQKYSKSNNQENEPSYLKQLSFNLNFIKLSFPNLDYSPPSEEATKENSQSKSKYRPLVESEFFQLENKEQMIKFLEKTQKALQGVRQQVQFSNWTEGNEDPQNIKRHKQLLKRQYFGGQFWKDKPKPVNNAANYLMNAMTNPQYVKEQIICDPKEVQLAPGQSQYRDEDFQTVKR